MPWALAAPPPHHSAHCSAAALSAHPCLHHQGCLMHCHGPSLRILQGRRILGGMKGLSHSALDSLAAARDTRKGGRFTWYIPIGCSCEWKVCRCKWCAHLFFCTCRGSSNASQAQTAKMSHAMFMIHPPMVICMAQLRLCHMPSSLLDSS